MSEKLVRELIEPINELKPHLGKTSVQKYLKSLIDTGVIHHVGSSKNGYQEVVDK